MSSFCKRLKCKSRWLAYCSVLPTFCLITSKRLSLNHLFEKSWRGSVVNCLRPTIAETSNANPPRCRAVLRVRVAH